MSSIPGVVSHRVAVCIQDFEPVGGTIDKNEKCADERILLKTVFDNGRKTSTVGLLTVDQYNG